MVFSETNTRDGLIQECERITNLGAAGISGNSNLLKDFTSRINGAIDRFYALVFKYDLNWNYDDRNQTDLPIATTSLISGQGDYLFDDELLSVTQVFAKDSSGVFHELKPQDDTLDPESYLIAQSNGTPTRYELVGNSILLTPKPNYNSSAGLKVTFRRNGVKFNSTDGSVTPGIPSLFHMYLARYASFQYATEKRLAHALAIKALINEDEAAIKEFVSGRAKPKRTRLEAKTQSNR